jgi:hypothetical protein
LFKTEDKNRGHLELMVLQGLNLAGNRVDDESCFCFGTIVNRREYFFLNQIKTEPKNDFVFVPLLS